MERLLKVSEDLTSSLTVFTEELNEIAVASEAVRGGLLTSYPTGSIKLSATAATVATIEEVKVSTFVIAVSEETKGSFPVILRTEGVELT